MPDVRLRLADVDYELPAEAIAQVPVEPRDAARLLVDRGAGRAVEHGHVRDLPDLLRPGDLVVVNDTRVRPARVRLRRASGGAAEVLLLERGADGWWQALVRPGRKLRTGERLRTESGALAVELGPSDGGATRPVRLLDASGAVGTEGDEAAWLDASGELPLPPYLTAPLVDPERYQTVFARRAASAAAPTAGLHLTDAVFDRLRARSIAVATVELVVGLDTFKPVTEPDLADHVIHRERYVVDPAVLDACRRTRADGGRVVAIGTTSVRALESAVRFGPAGQTDLFIRRPFDWQVVEVLLTNFHLPRTTLLAMIEAFIGPRWRALYAEALAAGYRFLSFGDAMLLERSP